MNEKSPHSATELAIAQFRAFTAPAPTSVLKLIPQNPLVVLVSRRIRLGTAFQEPATSRVAPGPVVPMPTLPSFIIVIAVVPPLLPTLKLIRSVVPTPDVDCKDKDEPTAVPPISRGLVIEVENAPVVAPVRAPL